VFILQYLHALDYIILVLPAVAKSLTNSLLSGRRYARQVS